MSAQSYEELKYHIGHRIVCVAYASRPRSRRGYRWPANVALECEDCNEVLLDYDNPDTNEE